ncbi:MAG: ABC transporter substrate-binding protein [Candidatus Rokuibacteriota bacterium]
MDDRQVRRGTVSRRTVLKGAAVATGAGALGGMPGILVHAQAPAYPKGTKLHLLQWSHYVQAADTLFAAQTAEFAKQAGVEIAIERIDQNAIQARVTAAVQSGSGADVILIWNNHPHLYESALVDMSDVAEEIGSKQGGWYDYAKVNAFANGRWIGVPQFIISWAITYREDWFREAGLKYPQTWDEFRAAGKTLKGKGKPFGQAFGHSINDPNNWCYPLVWMWGGMEVDRDGRTVVLDSKATVEAVKFNQSLWKDVFDEGGLAWDDSNNNRAFLSSDISLTGNAPSIYVAAKKDKPDVFRGTNHGHFPSGPAGRFYWLPALTSCVMKYSKNQKLAKEYVRYYMDKPQYEKYFETMDTFGIPGTKVWTDHGLWLKDAKTTVFRETIQYARQVGHAGPPGRKATEALSKYLIVDMFAKNLQGLSAEDAVKWATAELKKIYSA